MDKPNTEYIDPEEGEANGLTYGVSSIQGWRTEMEDAHTVAKNLDKFPDCSLYAVFDGHGGQYSAIFLSQNLVKHLSQSTAFTELSSCEGEDAAVALGEALKQAFLGCDEELRSKIGNMPSDRSGCTAIASIVTPTHVICANAGDSRGIMCTGGQTLPLSEDHKPWLPVERARIEAAGGCVSMKRVDGELAVARALGDFQFKDEALEPHRHKVSAVPDITIHARVDEDEFMVLACDGIWDVESNEAVGAKIRELLAIGESNCRLLCDELICHCLDKYSRDNMSVLVVMCPAGLAQVREGAGVRGLREARAKEAREKEEAAAGDSEAPPAGS